MKKAIIGLVMALVMLISLVSAATTIESNVHSDGGVVDYYESTWVGGEDWSEGAETTNPWDYHYPPSKEYTGHVDFGLLTDGSVDLYTYVDQPEPWVMSKMECATGSGNTEIYKEMTVWTEDKKIDPQTGLLVYPTEAWASVSFNAPNVPFSDYESVYFLMNVPPAQDDVFEVPGNIGMFSKHIYTDNDYSFYGFEGINTEGQII